MPRVCPPAALVSVPAPLVGPASDECSFKGCSCLKLLPYSVFSPAAVKNAGASKLAVQVKPHAKVLTVKAIGLYR